MPETIDTEPKLLLPGLKPVYDVAIPLAWPIIRIGARLGQGRPRAIGLYPPLH